jgi:hypothetical protein
MSLSDCASKRITATGDVAIGVVRMRYIVGLVANGGGAGRLTITNGSGGATLVDVDLAQHAGFEIFIPDNGIRGDPWVSAATNVISATIFYS